MIAESEALARLADVRIVSKEIRQDHGRLVLSVQGHFEKAYMIALLVDGMFLDFNCTLPAIQRVKFLKDEVAMEFDVTHSVAHGE